MTSTQSERKLALCPFCGGEASLALCGFGTAKVVCMDCGSEGSYSASRPDAIAAWNRRAAQQAAPSDVLDARRYRWLRECTGDQWQSIFDAQMLLSKDFDRAVADEMRTEVEERELQTQRRAALAASPQSLDTARESQETSVHLGADSVVCASTAQPLTACPRCGATSNVSAENICTTEEDGCPMMMADDWKEALSALNASFGFVVEPSVAALRADLASLRASRDALVVALGEGVRLYERYGLVAGQIEGEPMCAGKWVNAARAALAAAMSASGAADTERQ